MSTRQIELEVNGTVSKIEVEPRLLLSDALRDCLGLTGTHVGCEHGVCGACTIWVDGKPMRSCLLFAIQMEGCKITTIEMLSTGDELTSLQQAFHEEHGLQCGFCTAGILMSAEAFLRENRCPDETGVRELLSGHLCRCTGYHNIVRAIMRAASAGRGEA